MLCYRDRLFCSAQCATTSCDRNFTDAEKKKAEKWWGGPDAPVSFGDLASDCKDFKAQPNIKGVA